MTNISPSAARKNQFDERAADPPTGMGLTAVILGSVGALLFFLPVLGIPLGAAGLAFGIAGLLMAILGRWTSLRWSVAGIVVSALALGVVGIGAHPKKAKGFYYAGTGVRPIRIDEVLCETKNAAQSST